MDQLQEVYIMPLPEKFRGWKTEQFNQALVDGQTTEAEEWLSYIKSHRSEFPQYDDTWVDHRELALFGKYTLLAMSDGVSWYQQAKAVVVATLNPGSQLARQLRLEYLTGQKFDDI